MASTSSILVQHLGEKSFTARMENDETIALSSGEFSGFSPMDHLLIGLAGCTGTGIRDILRKMRQDVTDYQIRVRGVLSEEAPRIWITIDVEHIFTGKNLNADRVQHAIDLDIATRCGAHAMLAKTAQITHTFQLREAELADDVVDPLSTSE
jgi:putative redox protein